MAPIVLSPITKWFIGIGILAVLYFAIVKIYDKGLDWLDEQKKEAVDTALETQASQTEAGAANAQLENLETQVKAQQSAQRKLEASFAASRGELRRLEALQRAQQLEQVMNVDPATGALIVNNSTAGIFQRFDQLNKEVSHEGAQ